MSVNTPFPDGSKAYCDVVPTDATLNDAPDAVGVPCSTVGSLYETPPVRGWRSAASLPARLGSPNGRWATIFATTAHCAGLALTAAAFTAVHRGVCLNYK